MIPMKLALLAPLVLAACVEASDGPATMPDPEACGAPGLQGLVGQPRAVLAAMSFAGPVRVLEPGQPMTMDYNPARLNVFLDAAGRIEKLSCG